MAWENAINQQMFELSLSDEDVEELRSERSIKQAKVTNEEIEQLSIDENLSPLERLTYVLSSGQDIQKVSAINNIPDLLISQPDAREEIVSLLKHVMFSSYQDIQITTATILQRIAQDRLINPGVFINSFLDDILTNLGSPDAGVSEAWKDMLLDVLDSLSKQNIEKILNFLASSASLTQCSQRRQICCQLISHLVLLVESNILMSQLIPQMKALCQDIKLDIRSSMCCELEYMFNNVSNDIGEKYILPELCLLLQDEETTVRKTALSTITKLIPSLSHDLLNSSSIVNLTKKFYRKTITRKLPVDLITAAKHIGKILHFLTDYLDDEDKSFYLDCYQVMCCQGSGDRNNNYLNNLALNRTLCQNEFGSECRYWCAYNFPAILLSIPLSSFKSLLLPSFLFLMKDSHPAVRKTMASSLHEVSKILNKDVHLIYKAISTCLNDSDVEVLHSVLSELPTTLECLHTATPKQSCVVDLLSSLIACEITISKSLRWRTHVLFLKNIACLHEFVSADQIYFKFVPLLTTILNSNKVLPVKRTAAQTLLTYARYNRNYEERQEICSRIVSDLARSPNSRCRILFLDICSYIMKLFSKHFFKEHFYDVAMEIAVDSVVNVRMKFCEVLPLLKSQIRLPCDRLMLQMLEQTVRRVMALESDPDVANSIRAAIVELDSVRLSMDGTPKTDEDLEDIEKENYENSIMEEFCHRKESENFSARVRSQSLIDSNDTVSRKHRTSVPASSASKENTKRVYSRSNVSSTLKRAVFNRSKETSSSQSASQSTSSVRLPVTKKSSLGMTRRPQR